MGRVELHFHLLPDVDDGPPDLGDGARARRARPCATARAWSPARRTRRSWTSPRSPSACASCAPPWSRRASTSRSVAGAELAWDDVPALGAAELETVAQGPPGRRWLLLEAPLPGHRHARGPARQRARAARPRLRGADRPSRALARARATRPAPWRRLLAAGDRVQVNASSLTGFHGPRARARGARARRGGPRLGHRLRRASALRSRPEPERRDRGPAPRTARRRREAEALVADAPRALLEDGIEPRRLAA